VNWFRRHTLVAVSTVLALSCSAPAQNVEELFQSVQERRPDEVRQLLNGKPELSREQDRRGHTALLRAAYLKRTDLANLLVARGSDVNLGTNRGTRPLHAAAFAGADEIATLLLSNGADPNPVDGGGRTPLHWAAWRGHAALVEQLLARSPNVNLRDSYGSTPLHLAARAGHAGLVQRLLDSGADPSIKDTRGETARQTSLDGKHGDWQKVQQILPP
jgi:ankyrin repeat protein